MLKLLGRKFPNDNFPPVAVHIIYLLMSVTFCLFYNHMVMSAADLRYDEYAGIYRVLDGNAIKAIQFRILVPLIFKAFMFLHIPDRAFLLTLYVIFTYLAVLFFYLTLNIYFRDKTLNSIIALVLFYPMLWNFMLLNQVYFFVDHSLLFFMIACLYFVLARKHIWLAVTFTLGTLNHPSTGYIILVFMLFNYNRLFKKDTIVFSILLIASYLACYFALDRVYPYFAPDRGVVIFGIFLKESIENIVILPRHILIRDILFNFGGLHFFAALSVAPGVWKKLKLQYVLIFLIIIPYFIMGALRMIIRMEEMRNWIPLIPFVVIPALVYLSQIKNPIFNLSDEVTK